MGILIFILVFDDVYGLYSKLLIKTSKLYLYTIRRTSNSSNTILSYKYYKFKLIKIDTLDTNKT